MTAQHTPGPWRAQGIVVWHDISGLTIANMNDDSEMVGKDHPEPRTMDRPQAEANARLIAAAPELLEACKWVIGQADAGELDLSPGNRRMVEAARAAIAKATTEKE